MGWLDEAFDFVLRVVLACVVWAAADLLLTWFWRLFVK